MIHSSPADWRPALFSAALALLLYAVTLGGTYIYDDRYIILADPRVGDVSKWMEYWNKDYFNGGADNLYRPLVSMSYAVQAKLHGRGEDRAWAFHLVNWLLNAGVCAAVAELARRATRSSRIALVAGLLFAAHPIHVEAVANIIGRAELMCGLGILAALILFLRPLTTGRALAIWGCFVFAMLSKEQGMLLPLLLLTAIPLRQKQTDKSERAATLWLILLLAWTLAGYVFYRERILKFWWERSFLDPTINPLIHSVGIDRLLVPLAMFGRYIALLLAPRRLLLDYGGEVIGSHVSFNDPYLYLGAASAMAWIVACLFAATRHRWIVLFCLLGFALLYAMFANVLTLIGVNFAERLMFIPSAFVCIPAAMAMCKLPRGGTIVVAIVIALFSLRTITYAARWNHPIALFETAAAEHPDSVRLHLLVAEQWQLQHDFGRARQAAAHAREVGPTYYRAWNQSALIELDAGDFDAAVRFAREAQRLNPTLGGEQLIYRIYALKARAATRPAATGP